MRRRPSPALIVAVVALVVALGGSAIAASRYLITSTSQIKPSVLKEIRRGPAASAAKLSAKGVHAVVARIRTAGVATTSGTLATVPLTGATWSQGSEAVQQVTGELVITDPTQAECGPHPAEFEILLDGRSIGFVGESNETPHQNIPRAIEWLGWFGEEQESYHLLNEWIFEPGKSTSHTLQVRAIDFCTGGGHYKFTASIDVLGAY